MATPTSRSSSGLVPYRLTVRQFLKMIDAGVFSDGARVELLGGMLIQMTTNVPHDFIVSRLGELLRPLLPADWFLREEKSVQLGRFWRPQPDVSILRAPSVAFARRSPQTRDVALLIEVADTSYAKDSGVKLRRYAHVKVPQYWIVHLERGQVEVYTDPRGRGRTARYDGSATYDKAAEVPVVLDGRDFGRIAVREILP